MVFQFQNQTFVLSPDRAVFWQEKRALILSDLHIGKSAHFRKAGIPVSGQVQDEDLARLSRITEEFQPEELIVVGDMFHSFANKELKKFQEWREARQNLSITLVKGNHDILKSDWYERLGLNLVNDGWEKDGFVFTHKPPESSDRFTFSGHLHPGILMEGAGRQRLRLPCFVISAKCLVLPAFSTFTGMFLIKPNPGEKIIAIAEGELFQTGK